MKNTLTLRHRADLSPHYFSILENMRPLLSKQEQRGIFLVPFVLTYAAALECLLNDRLIQHCLDTYGSGEYRHYADRLASLSVRAKLDFVVPLLSGDRYAIRSDSATYGHLTAIISLRNSLTHNKSFLKDYQAEIIEVEFDGTPLIACPADILEPMSATDVVSIKPEPYHDSLVDLGRLLEYPYSFSKNKLVRRISVTVWSAYRHDQRNQGVILSQRTLWWSGAFARWIGGGNTQIGKMKSARPNDRLWAHLSFGRAGSPQCSPL